MQRDVLLVCLGAFLLGRAVRGDVMDAVLPAISSDLGRQINLKGVEHYFNARVLLVTRDCSLVCAPGTASLAKPQKQSVKVTGSRANGFVHFPGTTFSYGSCVLDCGQETRGAIFGQLSRQKVVLNLDLAEAGSQCRVTVKDFYSYPMFDLGVRDNPLVQKIKSFKQFETVSNWFAGHVRVSFDQGVKKVVGKQYVVPGSCNAK